MQYLTKHPAHFLGPMGHRVGPLRLVPVYQADGYFLFGDPGFPQSGGGIDGFSLHNND
jgi:hypothetical protein